MKHSMGHLVALENFPGIGEKTEEIKGNRGEEKVRVTRCKKSN